MILLETVACMCCSYLAVTNILVVEAVCEQHILQLGRLGGGGGGGERTVVM